jgi:hypothetical protein
VASLPEGSAPSFVWQLIPGNPLPTIIAQAPVPFTIFQGTQAEIYSYLMLVLGIPDIRAQYTNLSAPLSYWQQTIKGTPPIFDLVDWNAVVDQLEAELACVIIVNNFFSQYTDYHNDLSTNFSDQLNTVGPQANFQQGSTTSVGGLLISIFEGVAYSVLEAIPGAAIAGNVMEMVVNIATNATNMTSQISPSPFQVQYAQLWGQVSAAFTSALEACGQMQTAIRPRQAAGLLQGLAPERPELADVAVRPDGHAGEQFNGRLSDIHSADAAAVRVPNLLL